MGNIVVVKFSEYMLLSVLVMFVVMNEVFFVDVFIGVFGDCEVGVCFVLYFDVDKIMFIGLIVMGCCIIESFVGNFVCFMFELGGNDVGIVFLGMDVLVIVEDFFWGVFINIG